MVGQEAGLLHGHGGQNDRRLGSRRICDHEAERPGTIDRLAQKTAWQALGWNVVSVTE